MDQACAYCMDGTEGMGPQLRANSDELAAIEITMSCGCGGTVRHSFHRCRHCGKHYLSSAYMHREFGSSEDYYLKMVDEKDAKEAVGRIRGCGRPLDPGCRCSVHKGSEFLDSRIEGILKHSESLPH